MAVPADVSDRIDRIDVVVMVASAGGVRAVSAILTALAPDLSVPLVIQMHLKHPENAELASVLSRRSGARVQWGYDGGRLGPGDIVLTPPGKCLELFPDASYALVQAGTLDRPHDHLLISAAQSHGSAVLAVVLTGLGSDGAEGVSAVRAAGGVTIAQSADTAEHAGMPKAAAAAGAGAVLPLYEIASVIADVVRAGALPPSSTETSIAAALFAGQGDVRARLRDVDWARSALGRLHTWPPALRHLVPVVLDNPLPTVMVWGQDRIQLHNDHCRDLFGPRLLAGLCRPTREAWPQAWDVNQPVLRRVFSGEGASVTDTHLCVMRDGVAREAWFTLSWTPVRDGDGVVVGAFATIVDTSERVLSVRRLATISALSAGEPVADQTAREALRPAFAVLADAPDVPFALLYDCEVSARRATLLASCGVKVDSPMAPGEVSTPSDPWELQSVIDGDHGVRWMDNLGARFRGQTVGPDGLPPQRALITVVHRDVEEQRVGVLILGTHSRLHLDASYQAFLTAVAKVVSAIVVAVEHVGKQHTRLEKAAAFDRARSDFFSNVSDEFRTPLTLMLGPLDDMLADRVLEFTGLGDDLALIRRNARRLLRMVGTLLRFSQLDAGGWQLIYEATDLAEATAAVVAAFGTAARRADIGLEVDVAAMPQPVWVDPEMWEHIVANLVSNALKFTTAAGTVQVSLRRLRQHAELSVRDTGCGIPNDELPRLFERFHRVHGTPGRTVQGAGIGLAFVEQLVRRHGGRIRVTSTVGEGSTFTVWLPLIVRGYVSASARTSQLMGDVAAGYAAEAEAWDARRDAMLSRDVTDAPLRSEPLLQRVSTARVLVVGDNPDMRGYLVRLLSRQWDADQACTVAEALDRARADPPDLVISDVMMPRADGVELVRQMRSDRELSSIPVILVTAGAREEAAVDGLLAGAEDYLVKPFSGREVVARAGAQIELARLRRASNRRFDALMAASFDAVYRMSPDWKEMHALDGRGFIADTTSPNRGWLEEYIDISDQQEVLATIEKAIATKSVFELTHRVRRADGTLGWTLSRALPVVDDQGTVVEWVGTATDITAVKSTASGGFEGAPHEPGVTISGSTGSTGSV